MGYKFFDISHVMKMQDKNGEKPELIFVVSRGRGIGKTYSTAKYVFELWERTGGKFVIFTRTGGELGAVASGQFKGYLEREQPGCYITEKKAGAGMYSDVFLHKPIPSDSDTDNNAEAEQEYSVEKIGYVVAVNLSDKIKRVSSTFVDAVIGWFDEFQPENRNTYVKDEVEKFKSIHTSVSRGDGKPFRHFPVVMTSNAVSMSNPYFLAVQLHRQIQADTKKYRGDGFVYVRTEAPEISSAQDARGMSRAMRDLASSNYSDGRWFGDDDSGIVRTAPDSWGRGVYMATLTDSNGSSAGVFAYDQIGLIHISGSVDATYPVVLRLSVDGDAESVVMKTHWVGRAIRGAVLEGRARFVSQSWKNNIYDVI